MRWASLTLLAGFLAVHIVPTQNVHAQQGKAEAHTSPEFIKEVRPLLNAYCFQCHNTTKRKAGLDLEKIETESTALDLYDLWDQVGERLRSKEMPPARSKQPADGERQKLLAWVKHVADSRVCCDKLTPELREKSLVGYTRSRRLNRIEYNNTLRDLFGVDFHAGDLLPSEGGGGEGFDNTGATLFTTPPLLEKYLDAAEIVVSTLFPSSPAKENKTDAAPLDILRRKLLTAVPGPQLKPGEAARKIFDSFLPRAFRRPATAQEVERYGSIFDRAFQRGDSFDQALKLAFKGVLISPSFLFVIDTPPAKTGVYQPSHYEMASYLSYFLWASMPDEELFQLAGQGRLHDDRVLRAQVERMMRDPRARGLADSFAAQWFGIRPLGVTIRPDSQLFPEFDEELGAAMREETLLFFDTIIREDRSLLELLDAPYTFVNERLAAFYKIAGVKGPEMQRVRLDDPLRGGVPPSLNPLPPTSGGEGRVRGVRGGLLGQASILTVTSFPHRTSAVLRGKWILEELLGADVPPPPPSVPVLNEKKRKKLGLTIRQQLEEHRSKTECAACHQRMDPLGFGLENFDPVGRWRTKDNEGKPIDSVGVLPGGERFDGPVELKKLLLEKRRTDFLRNLSRKMLGYALGREVNRVDMCAVEDCVRALEQGGFRPSRLLETIVTSYPFTHRVRKE